MKCKRVVEVKCEWEREITYIILIIIIILLLKKN